ncbi:MAG: tyrosine-type recombinase/integrase [Planctomycetota bacterium]|jgi:integrase
MKIYKPTFKDKRTGKTKKCQHWYIGFTDNQQIRRRLPAFSNKRATEKIAEKIEELMSSCGILSPDLQRWIEQIPPKMRKKLVDFGLIDNQRISENLGKPLTEHLTDFCAGLAADNRKTSYIKQTETAIHRVLSGCKFKVWTDIDGNKVKTFLAKSRGPSGYGERTYNAYLRAFKEFCRWLMREGRVAGANPLENHGLIKQTEFRKKRRALTVNEVRCLLEATEAAPECFNMSGHERALVYRLALETGIRVGEIRSLKVSSFDFEANPPAVHVEPTDTKGKRPADLLLIPETATVIREFLSDKEPQDVAFAMPHSANTAKMLRKDLEAAGIAYRDESGRDVDAHALRHTFITNLALAGVHPAVAQKLARHSSIELTMKFYTHVLHKSEVSAIEALRNLSYTCQKRAQRQTATDVSGWRSYESNAKTPLSA